MLTLRQKTTLMLVYMRPVLLISSMGTSAALFTLMMVSKEAMGETAVMATTLKVLILAITALLFRLTESKDTRFFYINVGLSTKKLIRWGICLDISVYLMFITLAFLIRHGIG